MNADTHVVTKLKMWLESRGTPNYINPLHHTPNHTTYPTTQKHRIYVLTVDSTPFYVGYCKNRSLQKRFEEHIYQAKTPTTGELENDAIRGEETAKRKTILDAIANGRKLDIELVVELPIYEPIDEDEYIQLFREWGVVEGFELTNVAKGNLWVVPITLISTTPTKPKKTKTIAGILQEIGQIKKVPYDEYVQWLQPRWETHKKFMQERGVQVSYEKFFDDNIRYLQQ